MVAVDSGSGIYSALNSLEPDHWTWLMNSLIGPVIPELSAGHIWIR